MTPILFLAPFRSMAETAAAIAKDMGIPLIIEVTNDQSAEEVVRSHPGVEVVISRGGVAEMIKSIPGITVVEVTMSINDLLSVLDKFTRQNIRKIGIVSRANIFNGTMGDFFISQAEIYIRSCKDEDEISKTVLELHSTGVQAVIGCRMAYETARKCELVAEYIDSGSISVKKAIEEALRIVNVKEQEKLQAAQLAAIINNIDEGIIAVTDDKEVSFFNNLARRICAPEGYDINSSHIEKILQFRNQQKILTINGNDVLARFIPLEFNNKNMGNVITFQEISSIQDSERKIRLSLYQKGLYAKENFGSIIGQSESMRKIVKKAKNYAQYDSSLLIYGETGTGKEVMAQSVHNQSKRKNGPFVSVNAASIPPNLLESELFGYVEGAFTGARKGGKQGLFELAHGGTLFLDEIGELSPDIQSRLLRVLQEKEIMRIGDDKIIPIDVRIISATNRDLYALVKESRFRADLYYRICVLSLHLPPLRERAEDIPCLFEHYVNKFAVKENKQVKIHPDAVKMLIAYPWPGNIRELRNVAEVSVYSEEDLIEPSHIIDILHEHEKGTNVYGDNYITIHDTGTLKDMEAGVIQQLLSRYSPEEVCRRLGISRVTLWRKMKFTSFQK